MRRPLLLCGSDTLPPESGSHPAWVAGLPNLAVGGFVNASNHNRSSAKYPTGWEGLVRRTSRFNYRTPAVSPLLDAKVLLANAESSFLGDVRG